MDRAARCSQPATRNVGDPAKRLLRQNQSWLSKVRVAQLGNPTVRQLLFLGGLDQNHTRDDQDRAQEQASEKGRDGVKNECMSAHLRDEQSIHKAKTDDDDFPSHTHLIQTTHGQIPPLAFVYRAGSANNMSTRRLPMQKVWSQTFPTDRRAANHP
jgi:hypothetical protein